MGSPDFPNQDLTLPSPGVEFNFKKNLTFPVKGEDLISGLH